MKPHTQLLLLGALLLAPVIVGCSTTYNYPVGVQPPLTQEQVDEAVELAKKEAVKDLTQYYAWFADAELTPEAFEHANERMSEVTFFEVDYSVEGQSVTVYMVWTNGWWGGEGKVRTVRRDKADTSFYTMHLFHSGWRFTDKIVFEANRGERNDLNPYID